MEEEEEELEVLHHGAEIHCSAWRTHAGAEKRHEEEGAV